MLPWGVVGKVLLLLLLLSVLVSTVGNVYANASCVRDFTLTRVEVLVEEEGEEYESLMMFISQ